MYVRTVLYVRTLFAETTFPVRMALVVHEAKKEPCLCCRIGCTCTTASIANHLVSLKHSTSRLEATTERQKKQMQLELLGTRTQHVPPAPPGSLPALRDKRYTQMAKYADKRAMILSFRIWAAIWAAHRAKIALRQAQLDEEAAAAQREMDAAKLQYEREEQQRAAEAAERERIEAQERLVRRKHEAREASIYVLGHLIDDAIEQGYYRQLARDAQFRAEEAIRANADINTGRGKWAQAYPSMVHAYLVAFEDEPEGGAWETAQHMARICRAWREATAAWCKVSVTKLRLRASLRWGTGVMQAVHRTSPSLVALELIGFDSTTCSGLELISSLLRSLKFLECSDVGTVLEMIAPHLDGLEYLAVRSSRMGEGDGFARIAEGSCTQLATLEVGGQWSWPQSSSLFRRQDPLPPPKEEDGATARAMLRYARTLAFGGKDIARPLACFRCYDRLPDEVVRALCRSNPRLVEIELHDVASIASLKVPTTFCDSLESLELHAAGSLKKPPWTKIDVSAHVGNCPSLQRLSLKGEDGSLMQWAAEATVDESEEAEHPSHETCDADDELRLMRGSPGE